MRLKQVGVSLLEFVIGLVLLAIVLLGVTLFYANYTRQLDPVFQFRAVSLAEALTEQVLAVKYDHANQPYQQLRCGVNTGVCSNQRLAGHDKISQFTAVDDFQFWCNSNEPGIAGPINGQTLAEQLELPHPNLYQRLTLSSCVTAETDDQAPSQPYKRVSINVKIDGGDSLSFILHRYNIL